MKNIIKKTSIISLLLYLSSICYAEEVIEKEPRIGSGMSINGLIRENCMLSNIEKVGLNGTIHSQLSMESTTSTSKANSTFSMNTNVTAGMEPFGGKASFGMSNKTSKTGYSTSFYIIYKWDGVDQHLTEDDLAKYIGDNALKVAKENPSKFIRDYGYYYLNNVNLGVRFIMKYTITYNSYAAASKVNAAIGAEGTSGPFSASVSSAVEDAVKNDNAKGQVNVEAIQIGSPNDSTAGQFIGKIKKYYPDAISFKDEGKTSIESLEDYSRFAQAVSLAALDHTSEIRLNISKIPKEEYKNQLAVTGFTYEKYPKSILKEQPSEDAQNAMKSYIRFYREVDSGWNLIKTLYRLSFDKASTDTPLVELGPSNPPKSVLPCANHILNGAVASSIIEKYLDKLRSSIIDSFSNNDSNEIKAEHDKFKQEYIKLKLDSPKNYSYHSLLSLMLKIQKTGYFLNQPGAREFSSKKFKNPQYLINGGFFKNDQVNLSNKGLISNDYFKDGAKDQFKNEIIGNSDPVKVANCWENGYLGPISFSGTQSESEVSVRAPYKLTSNIPYIYDQRNDRITSKPPYDDPEKLIMFNLIGQKHYFTRIASIVAPDGSFVTGLVNAKNAKSI